MNPRIQNYRFEDSKRNIIVAGIIHLLLSYLLFFGNGTAWLDWERPQLCLLSGVILLLLYARYDWTFSNVNLVIAVIFVYSIVYELSAFGLPGPPMKVATGSTIGKGFMLDMAIQFTPYLYAGLRLVCVGLIGHVVYQGWVSQGIRSKGLERAG